MLVKHYHDPVLSSVLRSRTAEKWTAKEVHLFIIEDQREVRSKSQGKLSQPRLISVHAQTLRTNGNVGVSGL